MYAWVMRVFVVVVVMLQRALCWLPPFFFVKGPVISSEWGWVCEYNWLAWRVNVLCNSENLQYLPHQQFQIHICFIDMTILTYSVTVQAC